MEESKTKMHSIRGTRHAIMLTKKVKGMPGFAPEYRYIDVGEVVFNFPHNEVCVYFQPEDNQPILEKEDIEQIMEVMSRSFNKEEWAEVDTN